MASLCVYKFYPNDLLHPRKQLDSHQAKQAIGVILNRLEVVDLTKTELIRALKSKTVDLEDASQIECAGKIDQMECIVTRDKKGFKHALIEVLSPDEFLNT